MSDGDPATAPREGGLDTFRLGVLDALVGRLLPADELGGGAREAGVPHYIDRALAEDYAEHRRLYEEALDRVDAHAVATRGGPFATLATTDQDEIVGELERDAIAGVPASEISFFELVRRHLIEGMFCDPRWGGNDAGLGWQLIGYPGPRLVWTDAEQQLERKDGA